MLRRIIWAGLLALLAGGWAAGRPVDGTVAKAFEIGGAGGGEPTPLEFTMKFRGGERGCVSARGDHDPVVPLDVTVYDKSGAQVAHDESPKDFVAVFWVPTRTEEYRIVVRNHGRQYNKVYIVFK